MEKITVIEKGLHWKRVHNWKRIFRVFSLALLCLFCVMCRQTDTFAYTDIQYKYVDHGDGITITDCTGYDSVVCIPEKIDGKNVTEIGEYAFSRKHNLKKVIIPSTIKKIGRCAFFKNEQLSAVKIEKPQDGHEISIESLAMADCPVLSSLALPNNVTFMADDFVFASAETVLGTQSWSSETLYLCIETENDAEYILNRIENENLSPSAHWMPVVDRLDAPQNVRCYSDYSDSADKVSVTWNYVAGASAYQVYRSVNGHGEYQYIATVENNYFTEEYVQKNALYLYKIKAVGTAYNGAEMLSGTIGWDCIGFPLSDIRNVHAVPLRKDAVTLSWNARDDYVDGYYIYQKKGTSWEKIKEVKAVPNNTAAKRSTVISGLKCGKKYIFAVQAYRYNKQYNNLYSCSNYQTYTTEIMVRPSATAIQKITKIDGLSNKIQWKRVDDASGYVVYRATSSSGTYQRIAVIGAGTRVYYIDKDIKNGKKYCYKVAVYRNVNGKKIKSKVSKVFEK